MMIRRKYPQNIKRVRSKTYGEVIEVLVPTRFYWDPDGSFDGIEMGPFEQPLSRSQIRLMHHLLNRIGELMPDETPIPQYVINGFKEENEQ